MKRVKSLLAREPYTIGGIPPCFWLIHGHYYACYDTVTVQNPRLELVDRGSFWGGTDCVAHEEFPKDRGGLLW